ncbi:universal stress protein [Terriglobus tenax]|uniref:universal stress protein n=1 Tax=Terriglobus tenax TaxID=1111115 RepID=UPI0021DF7CD2|nr:universal stress protein [Terriglobus tenax]
MTTSLHPAETSLHLETTRLKLRRILVATDFSSFADTALLAACHLARAYQSELVLFHNITPPPVSPDATMSSVEAAAAASDHAANRMKAQIAFRPELKAIPHRAIVREGYMNEELASVAQEESIDLVVVGSHGARGFEKVLLGSVAESMLRKSRLPVMVVGPDAKVSETPQSILFATDLQPAALHAAQYATSLAEEFQANLTLLHVIPQPGWPTHDERNAVSKELRQLLPGDMPSVCQTAVRVSHGEPAREIVRQANQSEANLIVVGRHDKGPLADRALWTTLTRLIQDAPCPVLSVR